MNLDRLKSSIVSGVTGALASTAIKDKQNKDRTKRLQQEKTAKKVASLRSRERTPSSEYFSIPRLLLAQLNGVDCSPALRTDIRESIVDARILAADSPEVREHKLVFLRSTANILDKMPKRAVKTTKQRQIERLTGKGDYTWRNAGGDILSGLGYAGGGALGALAGGPYGAAVGGALGGSIGREIGAIAGLGDYTVSQNSIMKNSYALAPGTPIPQFGGMTNNSTRIRHREYVRDLAVPASPLVFTNTGFVINPGNVTLFPWLAQVAAQYQQYEFHGMVVEFRTLSSDITAGGALGSVILATNYDVLEAPFTTKTIMENSQFAVSTKPSCGLIHTIECDPKQRPTKLMYIRAQNSSSTPSQDARFMDWGLLQLATAGLPGLTGQVLGEIWISYDVSLYKPEVNLNTGGAELFQSFSGSTTLAPFGTTSAQSGPLFFSIPSGNTLTGIQLGSYIVELNANVGTFTGFATSATTGATITPLEAVNASGTILQMYLVVISTSGASVTYSPASLTFAMQLVRIFKIA